MQQKRGNKMHGAILRTVAVTIGLGSLVVGTVSALTLDTTVVRNIPLLQRLLITEQGDQTSSSVVEFSGTNNQLIRMLPAVGTSSVLQAPLGQFVRNLQISASALASGSINSGHIASGSIGANKFAFNIAHYIVGGGGGVNDGSCSANEVAIGFSAGTITCAPATLVSALPSPLCAGGNYFLGWAGIGVPVCSSILTGFSSQGGDFWQASSFNSTDIYFGLTNLGSTGIFSTGAGVTQGRTGYIYGEFNAEGWGSHYQQCPCDTNLNGLDPACAITGAIYTRSSSIYPSYNTFLNYCIDFDYANMLTQFHSMTVSGPTGGNWVITMNTNPSYPQTIQPQDKRCACDTSLNTLDCAKGYIALDYPNILRGPFAWQSSSYNTGLLRYFETYTPITGSSCKDFYAAKIPQFNLYSVVTYAQARGPITGSVVTGTGSAFGGCYASSGAGSPVCDDKQVGVGLNDPLETLHVSSPSTGMDISTVVTTSYTGVISYTTGPLMSSLYAVRLGTLNYGYQCPCDVDPDNADSCSGQTFTKAPPQYNYMLGTHSCYDMDLNSDQFHMYNVNISYNNNLYTLVIGSGVVSTNSTGMPRCSCDSSLMGDCQQGQMNSTYPSIPWNPADGYFFRGTNQGPSCYEISWAGGAPGHPTGPWALTKWDKVMNEYYRDFRYIGNGSAAAFGNPKCSCDLNSTTADCATPTFVGINPTNTAGYSCNDTYRINGVGSNFNTFVATTGTISSTGTIVYTTGVITNSYTVATGGRATMRADDQGTLLSLVNGARNISAGTVGALSITYNGPTLYVNGGSVGVNNDDPAAAFDVAGGIRFPTIANPGYDYLSIDNQGYLFATGNLQLQPTSQWIPTTSRTGLAGSLYYAQGRVTGSVTIGSNAPFVWSNGWNSLKLYVNGDITANTIWGYSDSTLKDNIVELTGALAKLLAIRGYTFQWSEDGSEDIGLLAQEVESVYPQAVRSFTMPGGEVIKTISYTSLVAAVIEAFHEIHAKLRDAGTERLEEQREQIETLSRRIEDLEAGGRRDGTPGTPIEWPGGGGGTPECRSLTRNIDVSNYTTNDPTTTVQYSCYTTYSNNPVNATINCGNGQILQGLAINGSPFMANCDYSTPSSGVAVCDIEGHSIPNCELQVNINWEG